jgi:DNA-binding CsgD family transcriptional regulator
MQSAMVKINHTKEILNETLLTQIFADHEAPLSQCQLIAQVYAGIENAISVLSDLQAEKSYIYSGGLAARLGLRLDTEIDSIWEEGLFSRIRPDDLHQKHAMELQFFRLLKGLPVQERCDYYVNSYLHMRNSEGEYVKIQHRMFYVKSADNGSVWMALCLYNYPPQQVDGDEYAGRIVNSRTGRILLPDQEQMAGILSQREKEVLQQIKIGKSSKEIAVRFAISVNTVNRHRQNILQKLHVNNSLAACRIADAIHLLDEIA